MLVNLDEDDWDAVIRVHLKGHFLPLQARRGALAGRGQGRPRRPTPGWSTPVRAPDCWAASARATTPPPRPGIIGLTLVAAAELARYGVQVNALAPAARTRMTEQTFAETMAAPAEGEFDAMAPENVSPLVVWLASAAQRPGSPAGSSRPRRAGSP